MRDAAAAIAMAIFTVVTIGTTAKELSHYLIVAGITSFFLLFAVVAVKDSL